MLVCEGGGGGGEIRLKVAVTDISPSIVTVQFAAPAQSSDQPAKTESLSATAVSVTSTSTPKFAESWTHEPGQIIPAGLLVTEPVPLPNLETLRLY